MGCILSAHAFTQEKGTLAARLDFQPFKGDFQIVKERGRTKLLEIEPIV